MWVELYLHAAVLANSVEDAYATAPIQAREAYVSTSCCFLLPDMCLEVVVVVLAA